MQHKSFRLTYNIYIFLLQVQNQGNPLTIKAEDNRDDGTTSDASILKISGDLGKDFKPMIRFMNKRKYIYRKTLQNKEPLKLPANIPIASAVTRPRFVCCACGIGFFFQ